MSDNRGMERESSVAAVNEMWQNFSSEHQEYVMAFEPADKHQTVVDLSTGAKLIVFDTSQIEFRDAKFSSLEVPNLAFTLECGPTEAGPNVIINANDIQRALSALGRTDHAENTALIRYILSGLVVLNSKWPIMTRTRFGSNYDEYIRKGWKFSYSMPSDAELASLTA